MILHITENSHIHNITILILMLNINTTDFSTSIHLYCNIIFESVSVARLQEPSSAVDNCEDISLRPPQGGDNSDCGVRAWRHKPEVLVKGCCNYSAQVGPQYRHGFSLQIEYHHHNRASMHR